MKWNNKCDAKKSVPLCPWISIALHPFIKSGYNCVTIARWSAFSNVAPPLHWVQTGTRLWCLCGNLFVFLSICLGGGCLLICWFAYPGSPDGNTAACNNTYNTSWRHTLTGLSTCTRPYRVTQESQETASSVECLEPQVDSWYSFVACLFLHTDSRI